MNLRKFYLIISIVLTIFLSTSGIVIITNLNRTMAETTNIDTTFEPGIIIDDPGETVTPDNNPDSKPDFSNNDDVKIIKTKPINILVVGGDNASQNTDTMFIVNFNPVTFEFNLLSVPRDTRVKIDNEDRKINFAYPVGGQKLAKEVMWDLLNIEIDKYIFLDISAFKDIVDALGGIDYNVPVDMKYDDNAQNLHIDLKAGMQHLDGDKAEQFIRFRKSNTGEEQSDNFSDYYNGSDILRINAQQDFLKELIDQKATLVNFPKFLKVIEIMFDKIKTDFSIEDILGYAYNLDKIDINRVRMFTLGGDDNIVDNIWYFDYNHKLYSQGTNYDANSVINKYFKSNND